MVVQILVAIADGIFVGRLGTDALAGIALIVPFVTLMFNVANGGMGGGVASAMARALGNGRSIWLAYPGYSSSLEEVALLWNRHSPLVMCFSRVQ